MRLDAQLDGLAQEREPGVLLQRAGEQPGLGEHLEAVADPDDRTAGGRELGDRVHHRREPGDRAGAQVVAVREPAGHDDRVDAAHGRVAVPEHLGLAAELLDRPHDVELAVRAGEQHDADPRAHAQRAHAARDRDRVRSITGLASSRWHISSTCVACGVGDRRVDARGGWSCAIETSLDVVVAERGERALHGRALRVEHAREGA